MKILAALLAFGAFAFSPTLASAAVDTSGEYYGQAGKWQVSKVINNDATSRCDLALEGPEHDLLIAFAPIGDVIIFGFSITEGANFKAGTKGQLKIAFISGTKMNEDFLEFEAVAEASKTLGGAARSFYGKMPTTETFLDSLSRSEMIGIYTANSSRLIAAIDLAGSSKAIDLLRRCAYSIPAN